MGTDGNDLDPDLEFIDALDVESLDPYDHDSELRRLERMRSLLNETIDSLQSNRSRSRTVDSAFIAYERNKRVPLTLLAGALASRFVIYVIPLIVVLVLVTGIYSDVTSTDPIENAREAGIGGMLAAAVENSTDIEYGLRTVTMIAVVFASLWAADGVAKLLRRTYAIVWVQPLRRPRWRWTLPFVVVAGSVVAIAAARLGVDANEWDGPIVVAEFAVEFLALTALWLAACLMLPHDPAARSWLPHLPGALLVAVGIIAMKWVTVFYFAPRAVTLNERYGEIASAILLLTWGYWIAFIVVFAAMVNAALFTSGVTRFGASARSG